MYIFSDGKLHEAYCQVSAHMIAACHFMFCTVPCPHLLPKQSLNSACPNNIIDYKGSRQLSTQSSKQNVQDKLESVGSRRHFHNQV